MARDISELKLGEGEGDRYILETIQVKVIRKYTAEI